MNLETQLYVGKRNPKEDVNTPLTKHLNCKARGGLFTSTYLGKELGSYWIQWCLANEYHFPKNMEWQGHLITIKKEAKIFTVDSIDDMNFLFDNYGENFIESIDMEGINFEKLSKDFHGLHITQRGEHVTRHPFMFGTVRNIHRNMYGWDVESTHFWEDVFETVEPITLTIKGGEDDEEF